MKNLRTYSEKKMDRREAILDIVKLGVVSGICAYTLVKTPDTIRWLGSKLENFLIKKVNELDQKSYTKLVKNVEGWYEQEPIPERGWELYARDDLEKNPELKNITSVNKLVSFYKISNGNKNPIKGVKIKRPKWK